MKRISAAVLAVIIAAMPLAGCGKTPIKDSKSAVSAKDTEQRQSETCQEAFTRMFNATYSPDSGEACYSYMFPQIVIDQLKNNGSYKSYIDQFNDAQRPYITNMTNTPTITEFTDQIELTDENLASAEVFFVERAADVSIGLNPEGINITEGYELHYNFIDQNGNPDSDDNECVVYIENDGWKVISISAEKLAERYPAGK